MLKRAWMLAALVLVLAACGGGDGEAGAGNDERRRSLSIEEPLHGAELQVPFSVRFSSNADLGPSDTGAFHVHVWFDGKEDDFEVVESDTFRVRNLPPGDHTLTASLRNADHSAAGAEDETTVTVVGGAADTGEKRSENNTGYGN